jgi:predicted dehydrogenase
VEIEKCEPLKNELEHFIHAIVNDEEPSPSGEEGKYTLYVAISAIKSYEEGRNIPLNLNA